MHPEQDPGTTDQPAEEGGGKRPVSTIATLPGIRSTMKTSIAPVIAECTPFFRFDTATVPDRPQAENRPEKGLHRKKRGGLGKPGKI